MVVHKITPRGILGVEATHISLAMESVGSQYQIDDRIHLLSVDNRILHLNAASY
jgi:hypothetical protein